MARTVTWRGSAAVCVVSLVACACEISSTRPEDAGADSADLDAAVARDTNPVLRCQFVPGMRELDYSQAGGQFNPMRCGGEHCVDRYQALVDGGLTYGSCDALIAFGLEASCNGVCVPGGQLATLADGGVAEWLTDGGAVQDFCCGNGPACACDEICWGPDEMTPPHCVPIAR